MVLARGLGTKALADLRFEYAREYVSLKTMSTYRVSSRDYLSRAKRLLGSHDEASLFYAAFELRCGIEARLQEYFHQAAKITKVKRDLWQIGKLGYEIEKVFDKYEKPIQVRFVHPETGEEFPCSYTPVTSHVRNIGKKLGDYLHRIPL